MSRKGIPSQKGSECWTTVLLVEQNANLALDICRRAYVVETGRIVLDGTGAELHSDPRVQKAYLGS
jgi:branched-chain amino acid transport system ATP-binding protein